MKCPKCGNQISDSSKFCPKCGCKIQDNRKVQGSHDIPGSRDIQRSDEKPQKKPDKKGRAGLYVLISIIVLVLAVGCGFAFYHFVLSDKGSVSAGNEMESGDGRDSEKDDEKDNEKEAEPETVETLGTEPYTGESEAEVLTTEVPTTALTTAVPTTAVPTAPAVETAAGETEHRYRFVVKDCTWTEAYEEAISLGGSLVNINSEEEYNKIKDLIVASDLANIKFWIGGKRNSGSYEYHWVDKSGLPGTEILNSEDYASLWMANEPSFLDGTVEETYMNIFFYKKENRWVWNDVSNDIIAIVPTYSGSVGYICEFE